MKLALFLPLVLAVFPPQARMDLSRMADPKLAVRGEKYAYLPLPANLAASGAILAAKFTGDGKGLVIVRTAARMDQMILDAIAGKNPQPVEPETILTWYDVEAGTSRDVWRGRGKHFQELTSPAGSGFVLAQTFEVRAGLVGATQDLTVVQPNSLRSLMSWQVNPQAEEQREIDIQLSPLQGQWVAVSKVIQAREGKRLTVAAQVLLLDSQGRLSSRELPLPPGTAAVLGEEWSADEKTFVLSSYVPTDQTEARPGGGTRKKLLQTAYLVDRATGKVTTTTIEVARGILAAKQGAPPAPEISAQYVPASATAGKKKVETGALVLVAADGQSQTTVFPGMAAPEMAPSLTAMAYTVEGAIFVRRIHKMDRAAFDKMLAVAEREEVMMNAKQAALASLMYGGDYDDILPGADQNIQDILAPYTKNADILKDFVYVFTGGDMSKVDKPAETVLGYIRHRGGRAVAYLDGHVVWIPDA